MAADQADLALAEELVGKAIASSKDLDRDRFHRDQSFVARVMVWVFAVSIGVTLLGIFFSPLVTNDWKALVSLLLEVIKIAVVPMFALVIGYYLPKSGR